MHCVRSLKKFVLMQQFHPPLARVVVRWSITSFEKENSAPSRGRFFKVFSLHQMLSNRKLLQAMGVKTWTTSTLSDCHNQHLWCFWGCFTIVNNIECQRKGVGSIYYAGSFLSIDWGSDLLLYLFMLLEIKCTLSSGFVGDFCRMKCFLWMRLH